MINVIVGATLLFTIAQGFDVATDREPKQVQTEAEQVQNTYKAARTASEFLN